MNLSWLYALSVLLVAFTLPIFSYLTLIYRELGRMTTGRVHEHLEIFEAEIEPKLKINRRSGGRAFRILGHFLLAFLVLETTRGGIGRAACRGRGEISGGGGSLKKKKK